MEKSWKEYQEEHYPYQKMLMLWVGLMLAGSALTMKLFPYFENLLSPNKVDSPIVLLLSLLPLAILFFLGIAAEIKVEDRLRKEFDEQS